MLTPVTSWFCHMLRLGAESERYPIPDITHVLLNGERDPVRDEFKEEFQSWNYAVRGKTIDSRSIRIAVTFDENEMLIVTVIPLGKRRL